MPSFNDRDQEIYRAIILEHYQRPLHFVKEAPSGNFLSLRNKSVSCVDDFTAHVLLTDGMVKEVAFSGLGCAISTAAGSIVADAISGKSISEALGWLKNYAAMVAGNQHDRAELGQAVAFCTIHKLPNRAKCAMVVAESVEKILAGVYK